ncbi:hypothetical protein HYQ21_gp102 [Acinetobacter phage vB_AbaM_Apostate]|uniref:Uncharacterized protein n=4 Tax=Lazarusvirus TaxID=2842820 RepID=A0A6B9ST95_9CAUD|nr:hypothetical protein HYP67_gp107 [Acinetobacter phage vB_ApiM_fHyAci03]YP_009886379.1 hypothetical protein HYQ21_gp102 [Acinetobacter phage vB_AbaM_Apostate]YP_009886878.1 hypothetical protein HYQ23_gp105 [Acinetobacter phage vB_AbaM_Lazarus]QGT54117.1 hypothetical protein Stupor_104 [Acinetobacter phage Stupor]QKN88047.1 hypothetical protein Abraxas_108 [Acinetobacter phage Abraxas]UNI74541.1 hypothetical protein ABNavy4_103 [Acinetobacter phage AB-Navy4]AXF40676.1 hypothetical protein Ac
MKLKNVLLVNEKPKTKHIMFNLASEYPARFKIEYLVTRKGGKVGQLTITCEETGRSMRLYPHQVEAAVDSVIDANIGEELPPGEW